ncbi:MULTISPECIES: fatty acyl-AMP ligase [unclassified Acinetobacter calcoaceticus/baumannii complex]|uniref:fatty acyl-AMP ligase n=1 Tax=unclassified Acinetobacter calcoaceticus/baumannii complex TaxID=2881046 RepID=UPI000445F405|nr:MULTISPECIES: fatty acyl-AMP ligase [unclassified Acinetobacter calcoaceticus/baumannii complex]EXB68368.1 AMP-binding enzyme family protein [Acinetobacter sp. 21871]EXR61382.1 AMP-binding enzyme family protein [Acinetobacter sp. 1424608]
MAVMCTDNIIATLESHANLNGGKTAFEYLGRQSGGIQSLTYADLNKRVQHQAQILMNLVDSGDRAVLLFEPGLDFIVSFFACLKAKIIAVPVSLPFNRNGFSNILNIMNDCEPKIVLTTKKILELSGLITLKAQNESLILHAVDTEFQRDLVEKDFPYIDADDVCFLQYTSGSTGWPKGVIVTHKNIMANEAMITEAFCTQPDDIGLTWLPVYHDMGLIGSVLQSVYVGLTCYVMSPLDFIRKPLKWLQFISEKGVTISGGPNFAYELCLHRISDEDAATLDLSRVRVLFNGAEPIKAHVMQRFMEKFNTQSKLKLDTFLPCYGLAEVTLLVSGMTGPLNAISLDRDKLNAHLVQTSQDQTAVQVVSCGKISAHIDCRIVNPHTHKEVAAHEVGEIWLAGESVTAGYWQKPEINQETFEATILDEAGQPSKEYYLRTGDMGFIKDGDLYVTGRLKDVIIIRGKNYYPQDIECSVEMAHPAVRKGCVAAVNFADSEGVTVVLEIKKKSLNKTLNFENIRTQVKEQVAADIGLPVEGGYLLHQGRINKTTSGKIRRRKIKEQIERGQLVCLTHPNRRTVIARNYIKNSLEVIRDREQRGQLIRYSSNLLNSMIKEREVRTLIFNRLKSALF